MSQDSDGVAEAMRSGVQLAVTLSAQAVEAAVRMRERTRLSAAAAAATRAAEDAQRRLAAERVVALVAGANAAGGVDEVVMRARRVAAASQARPASDLALMPHPLPEALMAPQGRAAAVSSQVQLQR